VAVLVQDMFLQLLFSENHNIDNNSATAEKISAYLESLEFYEFFDVCLTKLASYQILLN
jgi:hypothetical protein